MVRVGDKPLIWHIMKIYAKYGYNDFILALGYKSDYIKDFFLNQKAFVSDFVLFTKSHKTKFYQTGKKSSDDFKITFVDTGLNTLPGERILKCKKYIPETDSNFMVTYGDGVTDLNIKKLVSFHKKQKTIGTITGVHPRSKFGLVKVSKNELVTRFEEKPVLSDWVNGGYMVFKNNFFEFLQKGETEHPALERLVEKKELSLYKHGGFWYSIDTYKELENLQIIWDSGRIPWKVW